MKYSLRSLMVVVTLICVVLGGRIEYLRRKADFHERETARVTLQLRTEAGWKPDDPIGSLADKYGPLEWERLHHQKLALLFRYAIYRPWTTVDDSPMDYEWDIGSEIEKLSKSQAPAPNPPKD